ncbi:MAG TPA: flagellar FlbD family protein [Mycobacteriales bacterium]|nr:flagellar FlbD family protein [Mycobacteriales bacterium]
MIRLTRLNGSHLWMNPDLIASVEQRPDTTVTLVDGRHLVVQESPAEVATEMVQFRASILALADELLRRPAEQEGDAEPATENKVYLLPRPSDAEQG